MSGLAADRSSLIIFPLPLEIFNAFTASGDRNKDK
jgi:hypothetical protein